MAKRIRTFHNYNDPGHGWLKVKRSEVEHLPITSYSYQRTEYVYLEEDRDMSCFINDLKSKGIEFKIIDHHTNKTSKIRSYDSYQKKGY